MLDKIFPKLQFVITTHSPHLIASAYAGEIIKIPSGESVIDIAPNNKCYSGWSTDEILEDVMEVRNLENKEYSIALRKAMEHVMDKNSIILLEQIRTIDKQRLREFVGTLDRRFLNMADKALAISIGLQKRD